MFNKSAKGIVYGILFIVLCLGVLSMVNQPNKVNSKESVIFKYDSEKYKLAVFAGGCFWCMELPFENLDGVKEAIVGYTGGTKINPTYEEVSTGSTGHLEAVAVIYDPAKVSYTDLLDVFWRQIDPTDESGQFVDKGSQYRTAIFYHNEEQRALAQASKEQLAKANIYNKPIVTEILPGGEFFPAEEYHQDYYKKKSTDYKYYRDGSGRDDFLNNIWNLGKKNPDTKENKISDTNVYKPLTDEEARKKLTDLQYEVTREDGTEPAFENEYWDNKKEGLYVDIVSGEPLFASTDKYDSGTGWPSFTKPIDEFGVLYVQTDNPFSVSIEVRSKIADSHLGHVFGDGIEPTKLRYCINSAALRFIPKENLEHEGYAQYLSLFK